METALSPASLLLTAGELAAAVKSGGLSAQEVVSTHIERIEEVDDVLNAVVMRRFERALEEADKADRARAAGEEIGPLHGVPVTIKDEFDVTGMPTTLGISGRSAESATADAFLVRRLREAGAIVLGKTNVSQLLIYPESSNPVFGRTNNPWDPRRTPGGSSGGEAAIIAAGGSPLGLGADYGGSIRVPAHFCGLAALKPTSRRLSTLGTPGNVFFRQDVIVDHPSLIARSVTDLVLAMSVLAAPGQEVFDPSVGQRDWPDPAAVEVGALVCGLYDNDGWFTVSPAIRRAVNEAGQALEARGAQVVPFSPPNIGEALRLYFGVRFFDGMKSLREALRDQPVAPQVKAGLQAARIPRVMRPLFEAFLWAIGMGSGIPGLRAVGPWPDREFAVFVSEIERYREQFAVAMDTAGVDVLLCPPFGLPALLHGLGAELNFDTVGSQALLFNVLGFPAGTVPVTKVRPGEESDRPKGRDITIKKALQVEAGSAGLPVGVQVVGRLWREDVVLAVMAAVEAAVESNPDFPRTPIDVS